MASNSFGKIFRITTWGESHGKAVGVVIDGCPAGIPLSDAEIQQDLSRRAPGNSPYTSPRKEEDRAEIYSGVFEGVTTGAPISIIIPNKDADPQKYEPIKDVLRPGHANFTYLEKYGIFDYRGGGRASARETACRVAAGAVAKKLLDAADIKVLAYIREIDGIKAQVSPELLRADDIDGKMLFCPDSDAAKRMMLTIDRAKQEGDSLGGIVEAVVTNTPVGLGDPVYDKLDAMLANAMMSIPASKGVEIGLGFEAARMKGSAHNDRFQLQNGKVETVTNHAGGILAGISTGMPLIVRVAFKPPSSIHITQRTLSTQRDDVQFKLPEGSRHDPCVAIRAVPVVAAMVALVLADAILMHRSSRAEFAPADASSPI